MQADRSLVFCSPNWRKTLESFHRVKNNKSKMEMEPYPDFKVLAAIAKLAYSDCSGKKPKGWYLLTTAQNKNNGYFGCAVWSPSQQQIIVAHRGTDIKNLGAIWADVQSVYRNKYTGHMNSAVSFADEIKRAIIEVNKEHGSCFVLSFTGHSLGAWFAGVTTFTVKYLKTEGDSFYRIASPEEGLHAHTLALDSPGIEDILIKISRKYGVRYDRSMCTKYLDITNFFAAPNLVNCTGYQSGDLLQIHIERVALPNASKKPTLMSNIDTHGVDIFIKAFDDGKDTYVVRNWPHGWSERKYYHGIEMFCNSYVLHPDAIQDAPEGSSGSHQNVQPVKGNANNNYSEEIPKLQYSTIKSLGTICQLGVFSTEEFNFLQNWSIFQSNALMKRTEIEHFFLRKKLKKINFPLFKIDARKNTITCDSKKDLEKIIGNTKQLLRWFPTEIMEAMNLQNRSIKSAPLYMAGLAYLHTLPEIMDCEDTLGLELFLQSSKQVLQIIVTSDFQFQAARLYNILSLITNTTLDTKFLKEKYHTILSWNDMPTLAKAVDFQGLSKTDVNISNLIILIVDSTRRMTRRFIPILENLVKFSHKKLVIIKSQPIDGKLFEKYNLTVETNTLKTFELEDLTPLSREKIFSRDVITIGEDTLSLEVILGNDCKTPNEKINQLISPILKNIVMDNLYIYKIPNKLLRLWELDALYSKGNKLVDKKELTALLERSGANGPLLVISDPEGLSQDYWGEVAEAARMRILTTVEDGQDLFQEKCREESARLIYWFRLSIEGFILEEIHNRSVYLPRKFYSRRIIKSINEFVRYSGDNDMFIFYNGEDKLSLIRPFKLSKESEDLFVSKKHFKIEIRSHELNIGNKNADEMVNKHYFKIMEIGGSPYMVWQYSHGSLDGLRPFITRDYRNPVEERDFSIMKKKLTIIADDPGMGKTTSLTRMSEIIRDSWILRIDQKFLADSSKKLPPRLDLKSVTKFLLHASGLPTDSKMASSLLRHCLESDNSRQVCVLVDAFDEISDENKFKMVELLKYLKTATTCHTVVTTRVHQRKWLEKDLEEFSVEMEKITEDEQEEYLVNSWLPHLALELPKYGELQKVRLRQFTRELREEVAGVLGDDVTSFMGIPLQIRMLAEVFLQQAILFVISPEQVNNLHKITNLFDLYKQFIEVKKNIYFEQKTNINKLLPTLRKAMFKDMMKKHCVLAFQSIDPKFATKYFRNLKLSTLTTEEVKDISNLGLIKYKTDGTFRFIHRTFQEHFCADFFVRWLRQGRYNKEENTLIKNEFCKFLLKPDYKIIRLFIDTQLETRPMSGEELENHPKIYQHWYEHRQLFYHDHNKTPLHIAADENNTHIVGVLLSGPISRKSEESYVSFVAARSKSGRTVLNTALKNENTIIVNQITETVKNWLYESIVGLMLATFLNTRRDINDSESNNERFYFKQYFSNTQQITSINQALRRTRQIKENMFKPFIGAVRDDDYETVLKIFSDLESDTERAYILIATDGWGEIAINLATSKQNVTLFKLFAKQGVCVSYDKLGWTALHCASKQGCHSIVNFLLNQSEETYDYINDEYFGNEKIFENRNIILKFEKNSCINSQDMMAHINSATKAGNTALIYAAKSGCHKVVSALLKSGADTNSANRYGDTALMYAVKTGDYDVVRMLLEFGADINYANGDGYTALMYAAQNGYQEVTRMLLESKANINSANGNGYTAVMLAVQNVQPEVVRMLLDFGADINSANGVGDTSLIIAAQDGKPEVVRMLLESKADINYANGDGYTALMNAAQNGYQEVTRMLLEFNPDINSANSEGYTALMLAVIFGHHEVTRMLLEAKADINSENCNGYTALMLTAQIGHHEVTRMLLEFKADFNSANRIGNTPLILSARRGYHEVTRILLDMGADVNSANTNGYTALMYATQIGHDEMIRMLLESKADVNSANRKGFTALMLAAQRGYQEVTRVLLDSGANTSINTANSDGYTALIYAVQNKHLEVTRMLLESAANINSATYHGYTALMMAAQGGYHKVTRVLLDSGADINSANNIGNTAIMLAAQHGYHKVTRTLLNFRARINSANSHGNTALMLATLGGYHKVVLMLLESGADTNSANDLGDTALMFAAQNGQQEVTRMLLESGADTNSANNLGDTGLIFAAQNGQNEVMLMLLDSGAEINIQNKRGETALIEAAFNGHINIVELLVQLDANISLQDGNGLTALYWAEKMGHTEIFDLLRGPQEITHL